MTDIVFRKNKLKYLFFFVILLIILLFTIYFSIKFISNPSKYIYALMPNELIVFIVGIMGILGSFVLSYIMIKSIFNKEFFIRINQKGLFLGIIQYSNRLINWNDITKIEIIDVNNIKHIIIYIKNIEYYKNKEKGLEKYFFISRTKKYGTPYVINTNALSAKISDITEAIVQNWKKFK
ncbi:hypothetical protein LF887_07200 [Chryseobacterium sp. MEBOG06]|uniref:STM3941 family protein n=1 Tax=Chryseobacterium sp. MEBOG06 TaxID=2879938 RepID=UPI001F2C5195|nr:STM3941 family protein [Chryseobacterium sp. MEBOG06]UKB85401.1 hypothetical protein LF887_07200 [Chryseobacterium sp. MEBOG06]